MSRQSACRLTACIAAISLSVLRPSAATAQVSWDGPVQRRVTSAVVAREPSPFEQMAIGLRNPGVGPRVLPGLNPTETWGRDRNDTLYQASGQPAGTGRRITAIVLGLALVGTGLYVYNDSRGWAEPDFSRPGAVGPCQSTKTPASVGRCYHSTVGIGVAMMVVGGGVTAWGFGVP
jgi:hypothetical protein